MVVGLAGEEVYGFPQGMFLKPAFNWIVEEIISSLLEYVGFA
jgi:hypothetical protein